MCLHIFLEKRFRELSSWHVVIESLLRILIIILSKEGNDIEQNVSFLILVLNENVWYWVANILASISTTYYAQKGSLEWFIFNFINIWSKIVNEICLHQCANIDLCVIKVLKPKMLLQMTITLKLMLRYSQLNIRHFHSIQESGTTHFVQSHFLLLIKWL